MKNIKISIFISFFFLLSFGANAQYRVYHEIGGSIGPSLINGDWGKNSSLSTIFGFSGAEVNFIHNIQFVRQRIGIRNNFGFSYTSQKHTKDEWTVGGEGVSNDEREKLGAMKSSTVMLTLGSQFEYNFMDFGLYYPRNTWTPYVAAGFNLMMYMPKVTTSLGSIDDINNLPRIYQNGGIVNTSGVTASLKGAIGAKFKITRFISIFGEFTIQRSFSDKVDGLDDYTSSRNTDYINGINLGVKYVLY